MLTRIGQVAARAARLMAKIVGGVALLALLAAAALAGRLAVGPIDLGLFLPRIEAALGGGAQGPSVAIETATLGWQGFRHGMKSPFLLTLDNVTLKRRNAAASVAILQARLALAPLMLLRGRIVPLRIVIERPRVVLMRSRKEGFALAFGASTTKAPATPARAALAGQILNALSAPPAVPRMHAHHFRGLRSLRELEIDDAKLTVIDQVLGTTWQAPHANLTLERGALGGLNGAARVALALGHERVRISALLHFENQQITIEAHLPPIDAGELAEAMPKLASVAVLTAPIDLQLSFRLGTTFRIKHLSLKAKIGTGKLAIGGGEVPIRGATLAMEAHGGTISLRHAVIHLRGPHGSAGPTLSGSGSAVREPKGAWQGSVVLALDRVSMADLSRYWPPDIARGGRAWITKNVTAGTAREGAITLGFSAAPSTRMVTLTHVSGRISASGLVVHWLRPLPPATDGKIQFSITQPNAFAVHVEHAREGHLVVQRGEVIVTGLDQPDQNGAVTARIDGPLSDALALLAAPRLDLLGREKLPLTGATGTVNANLTIALPLLKNVTMDAVAVHTDAHLSVVRLPKILGGYGLDHGTLAVSADNDGLNVAGSGRFAGIPVRLSASMDFRPGPLNGVVEKVGGEATVTAETLARLGLTGAGTFVQGPIAVAANLAWQRNGHAEAHVRAGLGDATLRFPMLGFVEPPDKNAAATATLELAGNRIAAIKHFRVAGRGIALDGSASLSARRTRLTVTHAKLGRTEGRGSVGFATGGGPITITLSGPVLDLSARFAAQRGQVAAKPRAQPVRTAGPAWALDAHFTRILLAHGQTLLHGAVTAASNGRHITEARASGNFTTGRSFSLAIAQSSTGRTLRISTSDTGSLLAAVGVTHRIEGGSLSIIGRYHDGSIGSPLSGRAEIKDFRIRNAPAAVRVLEGMTLYGLVQAAQGPGLNVSTFITQFRLTGRKLEIAEARAFNPSLGATGKGSVDLATDSADLSGTIVPAYFFNSLLGRIPIVGRIFSPEKGGGLFAATYRIEGRLSDPKVIVNPLAALTPGFLRGFFSLFSG